MLLQFLVFLSFVLLQLCYLVPLVNLPVVRLTRPQFWVVFALLALLLFAFVYSVLGFSLEIVSFYNVYDVRESYRASVLETTGYVSYAVIWIGNVIGPFLITHGFLNRNLFTGSAGMLAQLTIYALTGFKSVVLAGALIVAIFIILWRRGSYIGINMIWGSFSMVTLAYVLYKITDVVFILYLTAGRLILLPGILTGYYYEFFGRNPKVMMTDSVLSPLGTYPYQLGPAREIGLHYYNKATTQANANVWADGYAQFGFAGMLVFVFLLGVVLWLYDSIAVKTNPKLAAVMLGIPAITLANNPLETSLLTHGTALVFLVIYLYPGR